jgi:hypothetical protein
MLEVGTTLNEAHERARREEAAAFVGGGPVMRRVFLLAALAMFAVACAEAGAAAPETACLAVHRADEVALPVSRAWGSYSLVVRVPWPSVTHWAMPGDS